MSRAPAAQGASRESGGHPRAGSLSRAGGCGGGAIRLMREGQETCRLRGPVAHSPDRKEGRLGYWSTGVGVEGGWSGNAEGSLEAVEQSHVVEG